MAGAERASTAWLLGLARRAHATTLEQRIAFAALAMLDGPSALSWQRTILMHADVFALGAAAPRADFRDWRSQVLYPRDGFWGGVPAKAALWFRNLHGALKRSEWSNAAYSAGVLAAYLASAADPFNTVRSDAGDVLHEAWRRSVVHDFDELLAAGQPMASSVAILDDGPDFLVLALGAASSAAAARFETALAHYDFAAGSASADAGFDSVGRAVAAERVAASVALVAAVFRRAITTAGAEPGDQSLLWPRALGWIGAMPMAAWRRSRARRDTALVVAQIHDEMGATGHLDRFLPESARTVREIYATDVEAKRRKVSIAQVFPFPVRPRAEAAQREDAPATGAGADIVPITTHIEARRGAHTEPPRPAPARRDPPPVRQRDDVRIATREPAGDDRAARMAPHSVTEFGGGADTVRSTAVGGTGGEVVALARRIEKIEPSETRAVERARPAETAPARTRDRDAGEDPHAGKLFAADDDVIRAPSVGVRTAADLRRVGVDTLDDFARVHPIALVARLEDKTLDPALVETWQAEVRLLLAVPTLTASEARIFVGAGFPDQPSIANADSDALCAALLRFALTPDGASALADGAPPSIETLRALIDRVRAAA